MAPPLREAWAAEGNKSREPWQELILGTIFGILLFDWGIVSTREKEAMAYTNMGGLLKGLTTKVPEECRS